MAVMEAVRSRPLTKEVTAIRRSGRRARSHLSERILAMNGNRNIPEKFQDKVNAMPEYSYGVTRVRVTLDDSSTFDDVFVAWGKQIVKVGTSEEIPFDPSRIASIEQP
jgi:hypothetical protein